MEGYFEAIEFFFRCLFLCSQPVFLLFFEDRERAVLGLLGQGKCQFEQIDLFLISVFYLKSEAGDGTRRWFGARGWVSGIGFAFFSMRMFVEE